MTTFLPNISPVSSLLLSLLLSWTTTVVTNGFIVVPKTIQSPPPQQQQQQQLSFQNNYDSVLPVEQRQQRHRLQQASTIEQQQQYDYALLFDCDGVILETEELHRIAYNRAFDHFNLIINNEPVHWSVDYYDILQNSIGGGKPKMRFHFRTTMNGRFPSYRVDNQQFPVPATSDEEETLIDIIQDYKTNEFKKLVEEEAQPRPGIVRLMDEALSDPTIAVGVCSASTKEAAQKTLLTCLGSHRVEQLNVCILGDDVAAKKPDPLIYLTARDKLNLQSDQCIVIEDSIVGLRAAVAANMRCIITYTPSTAGRDFYNEGAAAVVPDLESRGVTLASIFDPIRQNGPNAELLIGKKDPITVPAQS